jgi:hypothetical protein
MQFAQLAFFHRFGANSTQSQFLQEVSNLDTFCFSAIGYEQSMKKQKILGEKFVTIN